MRTAFVVPRPSPNFRDCTEVSSLCFSNILSVLNESICWPHKAMGYSVRETQRYTKHFLIWIISHFVWHRCFLAVSSSTHKRNDIMEWGNRETAQTACFCSLSFVLIDQLDWRGDNSPDSHEILLSAFGNMVHLIFWWVFPNYLR